jgi:hypothetical protein
MLGLSITSPKGLLTWSRTRPYRIGVVAVIAFCLVPLLEIVRIEATVIPANAQIVIGGKQYADSFRVRPRRIDVRIEEIGGKNTRTVSLSAWTMLRNGFRLTPQWRLLYEVTFACGGDHCPIPSTVEATLTDGELDADFITLKQAAATVRDDRTVVIALDNPVEYVTLAAGDYALRFVQGQCVRDLMPLSVPRSLNHAVSVSCP